MHIYALDIYPHTRKNYGHYVVLRGRYIYFNDPGIDPQSVEVICEGEIAQAIYINELYDTDPYDGLPGVYGRHTVPPSVMLKAIKDNAGYFIASK